MGHCGTKYLVWGKIWFTERLLGFFRIYIRLLAFRVLSDLFRDRFLENSNLRQFCEYSI